MHILLQMLPHPSYVYTAQIGQSNVIISGGFDAIVRVWVSNQECESINYELSQQLTNHKGFVTSSCINNAETMAYTSDSLGVIIEWKKKIGNSWAVNRQIDLLDLKGTVISCITLQPKEKRMLIHTRDSMLRLVDLNKLNIVQWLKGNVNKRYPIFICFLYLNIL